MTRCHPRASTRGLARQSFYWRRWLMSTVYEARRSTSIKLARLVKFAAVILPLTGTFNATHRSTSMFFRRCPFGWSPMGACCRRRTDGTQRDCPITSRTSAVVVVVLHYRNRCPDYLPSLGTRQRTKRRGLGAAHLIARQRFGCGH